MDRRRADVIADSLEDAILDGGIATGERLDEVRLAERFKVSRTPIREALHRLAQSGLAEQRPRRGVFVRQPGPAELVELFEAVAEFEAACARLAATRISHEALAELHEANARCAEAVRADDAEAYYPENGRFHAVIYRESGNAFLAEQARALHRRLRPFRRTQLRLRGRLAQSMAEHEGIVAALAAGDGARAADLIRAHVAVQGDKFHHLMASLRPAAEDARF